MIRTSPDHGTGFDRAGLGLARPDSMVEAISTEIILRAHEMKEDIEKIKEQVLNVL